MLVTLGKAGIKTLDDLADLATDELIAKKRAEQRRRNDKGPREKSDRPERVEDKGGVLGEYGLSEEQGNEIIMAARAHWFEDEPSVEEAADADSSQ
jgi:N utilization substance protein A